MLVEVSVTVTSVAASSGRVGGCSWVGGGQSGEWDWWQRTLLDPDLRVRPRGLTRKASPLHQQNSGCRGKWAYCLPCALTSRGVDECPLLPRSFLWLQFQIHEAANPTKLLSKHTLNGAKVQDDPHTFTESPRAKAVPIHAVLLRTWNSTTALTRGDLSLLFPLPPRRNTEQAVSSPASRLCSQEAWH